MSFDPAAWFSNVEGLVVTDEQWVVNEIKKGWAALQTAEQTIVVDVNAILTWLQKNQATLQADIQTALALLAPVAALIPGAAPTVAAATLALDATEAAIDSLSQHVIDGTTPMTVITSAYQTYKDASNAVSNVLKVSTTQPSTVSAAAAAQPVPVVAPPPAGG